ncbi:recombinase family protein [Glycomyces sp. NPDC047010]|uniref:recombinase family protein n=1 Tax=Glycomyces sp. NPDC047010 TaxID=3155023 RepID=UPI0033CF548A
MDLNEYLLNLGKAIKEEPSPNVFTKKKLRILGVIRLSHETDVTTSPERQKEAIELWADRHDHEIIGWAVDLDLSGGVDPFERDELGDWLNNRADEFDGMCAWVIDRYSRSLPQWASFLQWTDANKKTLATSDDVLDTSTMTGRMMAYVFVMCAQWEREMASVRAKSKNEKARKDGRYAGGALQYGYKAERQPDASLKIVHHVEKLKVLHQIVAWRIDGCSLRWICRELKKRKIKAPRGGEVWQESSLHRILTSPTLLGYQLYKGRVICGDDGMPRRFAEALISEDDFKKLLTARQATSEKYRGGKPSKGLATPYLLKDLAWCGNCAQKLYRYTRVRPRYKDEEIYRCARHRKQCEKVPEVFLPKLERIVVEAVMEDLHDQEVYGKEYVPANDVSARLEQVNKVIDQNLGDRAAGVWDGRDEEFRQIMAFLVEERKRLEVQPQIRAHWRSVPTGESYGHKWVGADMDTKREMLANAQVEVVLCANETVPAPEWWDPEGDCQHREKLHSRVVYVRWHAGEEAVHVEGERELASVA